MAEGSGEGAGWIGAYGRLVGHQWLDRRIDGVVTEDVRGDAVRNAQRACQHGPVHVFNQHQAAGDERAARPQPAACHGEERVLPGQLESQADARAPARNVVVQVAIQALEADVEVRRDGHQQ